VGLNGDPRSKGYVYLKAPDPSHLNTVPLMDVVATHEFGHVLRLNHSQRGATMDAPVASFCKIPGNNKNNKYICNPLHADDARGAVALYEGHAHTYKLSPARTASRSKIRTRSRNSAHRPRSGSPYPRCHPQTTATVDDTAAVSRPSWSSPAPLPRRCRGMETLSVLYRIGFHTVRPDG
jgi:hypothetical protein